MSDLSNPLSKTGNRRRFLTQLGAGAVGLAGAGLLAQKADAAPGIKDTDVLNFALNLEYLEAEYYSYALTGQSITAQGVGINGAGTQGGVTIKANPKVNFATPALQQIAAEIAADEVNHVKFLRTAIAGLGVQPVAQPAIDLLNSFNTLAQVAGLGSSFDPFASELAFFVGTFIFEDVGVTAYRGGSRLLTNKDVVYYAAGILPVEAYHASTARRILFDNASTVATPSGLTFAQVAQAIANTRATLSAVSAPAGTPLPDDQGILNDPLTGGVNLVPTDPATSLAFGRTARQVLNIVYGDMTGAANGGVFFPAGMNGTIK